MIVTLAFAVSAYAAQIRGRVLDASGLPLPGATITLSRPGTTPINTVSGPTGEYSLDAPPGSYLIRVQLPGFQDVSLAVSLSDVEPLLRDVTMELATLEETVKVVAAEPAVIGGGGAAEGVAINRTIIDNAQVPNNRFEDVLPLLPTVVRGPDGLISVAGARAPQGALLVNGVRETDPVTGQFAASVPLAAVDSVQVFATSSSAEYGNAVGGVTQVRTRPGDDAFHFSISSLDPRPHIVRGWIQSFDAWEPNGGVRGPLVRGRLWFAQSLDYRYNRAWFDTRVGRQPTRLSALTVLTQLDARVGDGHSVTGLLHFYPQTITHSTLSAFTPAETTPNVHTGGWSATIIDRAALGDNSALESRIQVKRLDLTVTPDSAEPYVVGHDLVHGGYFNAQDRTGYRVAWDEVYARTVSTGAVDHEVRAGGTLAYTSFEGSSVSRPISFLRSDGSLTREVTFEGPGALRVSGRQMGVFVQDNMRVSRAFRADVGVRFDTSTLASDSRPSPRLGLSYTFNNSRTVISGSAGIYADKLVLGAAAFPMQQARTVSGFDTTGQNRLESVIFTNTIAGVLRAPRARAWNAEIDHEIGSGWMTRLKYQERQGYEELVVTPVTLTGSTGEMVLSSSGESRARSLELTVGRRTQGHELYASYVRSSSRGNLNDLNAVQADYPLGLVQADQVRPLAIDVPHRLLVWGIVKLPRRITVAPFLEVRSGFPYSVLDENWNEVGARNSRRFPVFASLDIVASKVVSNLPFHLPPARIGIKLFNVTGRFNARDIQRDFERPDSGMVYNPMRRTLRGIFEFIWGGEK